MDLDSKIQANAQGLFVLTFFNEREKSLTERTVHYIFSKFGQVSEIKYAEHGPVFISYKEKEEALKALEIMNMGTKYHVEIDWQPVKKNETVENMKSEGEESFIYLHLPPNMPNWGMTSYVSHQLFGDKQPNNAKLKTKTFVFSWLYREHMKIVFDSKMAKDEIMEKHQKNPFKWPKCIGGDFEFCDDLPNVYIRSPNLPYSYHAMLCYTMFGNEMDAKTKIRSVNVSRCGKLMVVVFDAKITKDEVMKAHNKKPFVWPGKRQALEFLNTSEALSMYSMYQKERSLNKSRKF